MSISRTTLFVAIEIRATHVLSKQPVTHADVVPIAIPPHGDIGDGTWIFASTRFVAGSIRTTSELFGTDTHTEPAPWRSPAGPTSR